MLFRSRAAFVLLGFRLAFNRNSAPLHGVQATRMSAVRFVLFAFSVLSLLPALQAAPVDFVRDVLPVFQRTCFECHDAKNAKGKFRLDSRAEAFKKPELIRAGQAVQSELFRRITLPKGHDEVMPNRGEPLSKSQIEIIRAWIDQGAS